MIESGNKAAHDAWVKEAIDYKIGWDQELERRQRLGIKAPVPLPHPDDIIINRRTGKVEIKGPFTKEEKADWDRLRQRKEECDLEIRALTEDLQSDPDNTALKEDLEYEKRLRAKIAKAIPD